MLGKLGLAGVLGVLVLVAGIGLLAWVDPLIAAGIALVVVGMGLVVYGVVTTLLSSFGMGGAI